MQPAEINNYRKWLDRSPAQVLAAVVKVGGWKAVFQGGLPLWAHRVRNYFNIEPIMLTRYDVTTGHNMVAQLHEGLDKIEIQRKNKWLKNHPIWKHHPDVKKLPSPPPGTGDYSSLDRIAEVRALSEYVYKDGEKRTWFQMDAGGTIYHFKDPTIGPVEGVYQSISGQHMTPIFKLVSPDGSGGSCETIIDNPVTDVMHALGHSISIRRLSLGDVGQAVLVSHRLNTDSWFQGSYNYAETAEVGKKEHDKFDVDTHTRWKRKGVYVNPDNRFLSLALRKFPERAPGEQTLLADQIKTFTP